MKEKRKKEISKTAKTFAKNLKYYRKKLKWDQNTLSKASDVSLTYTNEVENEQREVSLHIAQKFAKSLKVDLQKMLEQLNDDENS